MLIVHRWDYMRPSMEVIFSARWRNLSTGAWVMTVAFEITPRGSIPAGFLFQ